MKMRKRDANENLGYDDLRCEDLRCENASCDTNTKFKVVANWFEIQISIDM